MNQEFFERLRVIVEQMLLDMQKRWWWFLVAAFIYVVHLFLDDWLLSAAKSALARAELANYPKVFSSAGLWVINALPTSLLTRVFPNWELRAGG